MKSLIIRRMERLRCLLGMNKQYGFSLMELLVVLSIWSLLLLLSAPILVNSLEKQEEEQFFKVFESDVLYIQYAASLSAEEEVSIHFSDDHYTVRDGSINGFLKRNFPSTWKIDMRSMKYISFTDKGNIRHAGTIQVDTKNAIYLIVFPLGKGRGYIVKQ